MPISDILRVKVINKCVQREYKNGGCVQNADWVIN